MINTPSSAIVTIRGYILFLTKSISMLIHTTGLKSRILGYISKGDMVPLVNTTD